MSISSNRLSIKHVCWGLLIYICCQTCFAIEVPQITLRHHVSDQLILNKSKAIHVITQQQIKKSGATSIAEVLATQSNIQLQDLMGDGTKLTVGMRGFGDNAGSNTLILINGVPQNNPDLATTVLNKIPLNNVERIVILPGSQSVLYGDQAVAGVVNIITKDIKKSTANTSVGYGSYHHQIYTFNMSHYFKDGLSLYFGGVKDMTHNYRQHNDDDQSNLHFNLTDRYDSGRLGIFYNFYHQNLQYAGALTGPQEAADRRQKQPGTNNFTHETHHNVTLNWKQLLNDHWTNHSLLSYRNFSGHGQLYGPFTQVRDVVFLKNSIKGNYQYTTVTTGGNFKYTSYNLDAVGDYSNELEKSLAGFVLVDQAITHYLTLETGARAAHFNIDSTQTSGVNNFDGNAFVTLQSLLWHLNKHSVIYMRRAGNFRFPKAEENAEKPTGVNHLRTQTGTSYDLGYKYAYSKIHANTNIYYMRLKNEIVFDPTQTATQKMGVNRNLPPTDRLGTNVALRYQLTPHFNLAGQYSYVDAVFRSGNFKGKRIPFVASNTFHLDMTVDFLKHWTLYLDSLYTGHRYASGDDANQGYGIPAYVIFNGSITFNYKRLSLVLRANNIFNKYYNAYASFVTYNNTSTEYYYPAAGRNVMLTASVDLW